MKILRIETGFLEENCWLLLNTKNEAIIIDPGDNSEKILAALGDTKLELILLTHSHSDHRGALSELIKKTNSPVAIHFAEAEIIENGETNPPSFGGTFPKIPVSQKFKGGEILDFKDEKIEVVTTPGHSPGSVCFLVGDELFSGDTLFHENVGRTDLVSGNENELNESLAKLLKLKPKTRIYPGHGPNWTIGEAQKFFV